MDWNAERQELELLFPKVKKIVDEWKCGSWYKKAVTLEDYPPQIRVHFLKRRTDERTRDRLVFFPGLGDIFVDADLDDKLLIKLSDPVTEIATLGLECKKIVKGGYVMYKFWRKQE